MKAMDAPMREKGGGEGRKREEQDVTYLQAKMDDSDEPALYLRANSCHLSGGRVVTVNTRQWPLFVRRYPLLLSVSARFARLSTTRRGGFPVR